MWGCLRAVHLLFLIITLSEIIHCNKIPLEYSAQTQSQNVKRPSFIRTAVESVPEKQDEKNTNLMDKLKYSLKPTFGDTFLPLRSAVESAPSISISTKSFIRESVEYRPPIETLKYSAAVIADDDDLIVEESQNKPMFYHSISPYPGPFSAYYIPAVLDDTDSPQPYRSDSPYQQIVDIKTAENIAPEILKKFLMEEEESEEAAQKLKLNRNNDDEDKDYKVLCHITNWSFYRKDDGKFVPENLDPNLCTHIIYSFASLDPGTLTIKTFDPWTDIENDLYRRTIKLDSDIPVLLAIGGWTDSTGTKYSSLVGDSAARKRFITSVVKYLNEYGFSGLHVDWNYPKCWQSDCSKGPDSDKPNFTDFIEELSEEFDRQDPPLYLGVAISGYKEVITQAYELDRLSNAVDFLTVMTYDYHGAWEENTGHVSPLYGRPGDKYTQYNTDYTMQLLVKEGAAKEKLIMGVPFYGQSFTLRDSHTQLVGEGTPSRGPGNPGELTQQPGMLSYSEICTNIRKQKWKVGRDGTGKSGPYATMGNQWVGYEDARSMEMKAKYVMDSGYAGIAAWTIDLDDYSNKCCFESYPLLKAINRKFGRIQSQKPGGGNCQKPPIPVTPVPPVLTTAIDSGGGSDQHNHQHQNEHTTWPGWKPTTPLTSVTTPGWSETEKTTKATTPWWEAPSTTAAPTRRTTTRKSTTTRRPYVTTTRRPITTTAAGPTTMGPIIPGPVNFKPEVIAGEKCENNHYKPHPENCNAYYRCILNDWVIQYCNIQLNWNQVTTICDWPASAKCKPSVQKEEEIPDSDVTTTTQWPTKRTTTQTTTPRSTTTARTKRPTTRKTTKKPFTTRSTSRTTTSATSAHFEDVDQEYLTTQRITTRRTRPTKGSAGSPPSKWTSPPRRTTAATTTVASTTAKRTPPTTRRTTRRTTASPATTQKITTRRTTRRTTTTSKPSSLPSSTAAAPAAAVQNKPQLQSDPTSCKTGSFYPHKECDRFYICINNKKIVQYCGSGYQWNAKDKVCDTESNVRCISKRKYLRLIGKSNMEKEISENDPCDGKQFVPHPSDCNLYFNCVHDHMTTLNCASGLHWNNERQTCDWPKNAHCETTEDASTDDNDNSSLDDEHHSDGHDNNNNNNNNNNNSGRPTKRPPKKPAKKPVTTTTTTPAPTTTSTERPSIPPFSGHYKLVCYFTNWAWYRPGIGKYTPNHIDTDLCTHIVYGFAVLDYSELTIRTHDSWADIDNKFYARVVAAKERGVRVTLALGGWNDSLGDKYSRLVRSPAARAKFIKHAIGFIEKYGFEGLDLDWEYPVCWQTECNKGFPDEKDGFTALVRELSEAFRPKGLLLSSAVSPSKKIIDAGYDVPALSDYFDWIAVMTYDYHGQWDKKTGHVAPLFYHEDDDIDYFNSNFSINYWLDKGADPRKIIMGMPLYGQSFTLADTKNNELNARAPGPGIQGEFTRAPGFLAYYEICHRIHTKGWKVMQDERGRMGPYAYGGNQWVSFDDAASLRRKSQYIRSLGLGGGMVWALDLDDFNNRCGEGHHPLLREIQRVLREPPKPHEMMPTVITEKPFEPEEAEYPDESVEEEEPQEGVDEEEHEDEKPAEKPVDKPEEKPTIQSEDPDADDVDDDDENMTDVDEHKEDSGDFKVVCYFTNWAWYRQSGGKFLPEDIDPELCSHIIYGFAVLNRETLTIKPHDSWADIDNRFYERVAAFRSKGVKVLVAIGGWNDSAGDKYSRLVRDPAARARFIRDVAAFIEKYEFDGLDLDWEYPVCWQVDCKAGEVDEREGFADFVRELAEEFHPRGWLLSAAVSPNKKVIDLGYDVESLSNSFDWISVMAYDFHGQWDKITGHVAPMYEHPDDFEKTFTAHFAISYWLEKGADPKKIVMGMPMYGQSFSLADNKRHDLNSPTYGGGEAGEATRARGFLAYYEICENIKKKGWQIVRDPKGRMGPYAFLRDQWVSYDDIFMIRHKSEYVKALGLGGAMIWALDLDDFRNVCDCEEYPLLKTINRVLRNYPGPQPTCSLDSNEMLNEEAEEIIPESSTAAATTTMITTTTKRTTTRRPTRKPVRRTTTVRTTSKKPPRTTSKTTTTTTTTMANTHKKPDAKPTKPSNVQMDGMSCNNRRFIAHQNDCNKYYQCEYGQLVEHSCPPGLYWNKNNCDWPQNSNCKQPEDIEEDHEDIHESDKPSDGETQEETEDEIIDEDAVEEEEEEEEEEPTTTTARTTTTTKRTTTRRPRPSKRPMKKPQKKPPQTKPPSSSNKPKPTKKPVVSKPMEEEVGGSQYKVVCYFTNWAWYRPGEGKYTPDDIDDSLCTHIVYGFAVLNRETSTIRIHDAWADVDNRFFERVSAYRSKGVHVTVAIGGWNDSLGDKYSKLVRNPAARAKFIRSVVEFNEKYNFEGLDLDWEYPVCWQVDCEKGFPDEKQGFADLVRELSEEFKPRGWLLSAAVSPSKMVIDAGYDVPTLSEYFDWIAVMTYDFHGHWDKKTGHVAPLYYYPGDFEPTFNGNFSMNYWLELGANSKKLIMGIPLYGQSFALGDSTKRGYHEKTIGPGEPGQFTRAGGFLAYYEICEHINDGGWTVVRDPKGRIGPYAYSGSQWVSYDDVAEIRRKAKFLKKLNLGGGMVWALDLDDFRGRCGCGKYPLLRTLNQELRGIGGQRANDCT